MSRLSQTQKSVQEPEFHLNSFYLKKMPDCKGRNSIPKNTVIDFASSLTNPHQLNPAKKKYLKTIPLYNLDGLFYTSTFVVPYFQNLSVPKKRKLYQKQKYENFRNHLAKMKKMMSDRIGNQGDQSGKACQQIPEIKRDFSNQIKFDPGKENYCSICSKEFKDYWEHVNSQSHLKGISENKANKFIKQLSQNYEMLHHFHQKKESITMDTQKNFSKMVGQPLPYAETPPIKEKRIIPATIIPEKKVQESQPDSVSMYRLEVPSPNGFCLGDFQGFNDIEGIQNSNLMFGLEKQFLGDNYQNKAEKKGIWSNLFSSRGQKNLIDYQLGSNYSGKSFELFGLYD